MEKFGEGLEQARAVLENSKTSNQPDFRPAAP
jgi:hypothetical protein